MIDTKTYVPRLPGVTRTPQNVEKPRKTAEQRIGAVLAVSAVAMIVLGFVLAPGWFALAFFAIVWSVVLSHTNFEWAAPCPHEVRRLFDEPPEEDPFDKFRPGTYKYELYFGSAGFDDD